MGPFDYNIAGAGPRSAPNIDRNVPGAGNDLDRTLEDAISNGSEA